jgi:sugar diacid utilization regulator
MPRSASAADVPDEAVQTIVGRLSPRLDEITRGMVERYRAEIVDYRLADPGVVDRDVYEVSFETLRRTVGDLARGHRPTGPEDFDQTRRAAARRVHQDMSLESFLHATRLWGRILWETVLSYTDVDIAAEREAALRIAGQLLEHLDLISTAAAQGYLDELQGVWSDREVVRRDLLEALIAGEGHSARVHRLARSVRLTLAEKYIVVIVRGGEGVGEGRTEGGLGHPLATRVALRRLVEAVRAGLKPTAGSLLVGMRHGEVVALYPYDEPGELDAVTQSCEKLAGDLAEQLVSVGISGMQHGLAGLAASYADAQEALEIAVRRGAGGRVVAFKDVLIDSIVHSSRRADRILGETVEPLLRYDADRQSELVRTLRAYIDAGFNLTRSAELLQVHPNTVVYRLRRVEELTGRDPHVPDDLLLLYLGLKLLGPGPGSS